MTIDPKVLAKIKEVVAVVMTKVVEVINTPDATGKSPKDYLIDEVRHRFAGLKEVLTTEGLKIALSYKEESRESLSFQDLLSYIKTNFKLEPGVRVCILKTDGDVVQLDIMVCDVNNNPSFSPVRPWVHFNVVTLDDGLLNMFCGKQMLVLK